MNAENVLFFIVKIIVLESTHKIIAISSTLFIILETRKMLINRKTLKVAYTT